MGSRAGWREWAGLAVLALAVLLVSIDLFVMLMAVPRLSADLHASSVQQLWIVDIYGFMVAGLLITMGTVGDRIGRRRLLLSGAAAFGVASVLTAYAPNPALLIAARALLGIAGATLTPSTLALITSLFRDPRQRATAIAIWGGCFSVGAIVGPLVGGAMLDHFWWGSVFLIGVPVMVTLLALGPVLLPEYRDANAGRVDIISVALSLAAILPFIYGLKELASSGWHPGPGAALAAGIAVGVIFVRRQRLLQDPLLDLRLFGDRAFAVTLGGMLMYSLAAGGTMTFLAQHFQRVDGLSPLGAGLAMVPGMASSIISFQLAALLGRRIRPGLLFPAGLAITVAGLVVITQSAGVVALAAGFAIACFGTGPRASSGGSRRLAKTAGGRALRPEDLIGGVRGQRAVEPQVELSEVGAGRDLRALLLRRLKAARVHNLEQILALGARQTLLTAGGGPVLGQRVLVGNAHHETP
jgi:DHA2 family multidrug resistance protein-like MFS transporter